MRQAGNKGLHKPADSSVPQGDLSNILIHGWQGPASAYVLLMPTVKASSASR